MTDIKEQLSQLNKMSKKSVALYHQFALSIGASDSSLGVLYALMESETPCSQYDLCNEWFFPKQTINTAVAALQKKGLVTLSPIPGTRNKKNIALTAAGKKFAKKHISILRDAELEALSELSEKRARTLYPLESKIQQVLERKTQLRFAGKLEERRCVKVSENEAVN